MKHLRRLSGILLLALSSVVYADSPAEPIASTIIPVEAMFQHAKFNRMQISPNGQHLAFTYESGSETRLAVMAMASRQILSSFDFGENMHVVDFHWANDGRVLMEVAEITGNLVSMTPNFVDLYAANIDGTRRTQLHKVETAVMQVLHMLPDQPDRILVARQHYTERRGWRAHILDINRGRMRFIDDQPQGQVQALIPDNRGEIRIGLEFVSGDTFDENRVLVHYKQGSSWTRLELDAKRNNPVLRPVGFSSDNRTAYFLSNYDIAEGAGDRIGLFAYNFDNNAMELITRHDYADITSVIRAHDGDIIGVNFSSAGLDSLILDSAHPDVALLRGLKESFENQWVTLGSFNRDGTLLTFQTSSPTNPGEFFVLDRTTGQAGYLASMLDGVEPELLNPVTPIHFTARDGTVVRGFLTTPRNQDKSLPLIVNVHGGPFGVFDTYQFNREAQFFAQHGYATLQINFRGSGGYGQDFERLGRLQWGRAMQDDITDGTLWAIEQGIADANRVCIYGGSYGGYAAVWGVIREPELYRCSVGFVGVYDMTRFFRNDGSDASRNRTSIRQYLESHIGSETNELIEISPVHHAQKIRTPLFLIHGSRDVRVPILHANLLRAALDQAEIPYRWLVKEDGHGFYQVENRVAMYTQMLEFFEQHIGTTVNE